MVTENMSLTIPPPPSEAVTLTAIVPTFEARGVPEKILVVELKTSHVGSGVPSASVAAYVSVVPASGSENVFSGTV